MERAFLRRPGSFSSRAGFPTVPEDKLCPCVSTAPVTPTIPALILPTVPIESHGGCTEATQRSLLEQGPGSCSFSWTIWGWPLLSVFLFCTRRQGCDLPQMRAVWELPRPPARPTTAGYFIGFEMESVTTSSHALTVEDVAHPRGETQPGRIGPIITLIIYFSPSTAKPARERSLIPSAFQSCNIYSKPEPLTVNVLSEELHGL